MARKGDLGTRGEVTERVDRNANDLQEKADASEKVVEDVETVRETRDEVELGGTADGADEVEQALDTAEDTAVDIFDDRDEEVEQQQEDSEEHEEALREGRETCESDREKIADKGSRIDTAEVAHKQDEVHEATNREIEFLDDYEGREAAAREESEQLQREHQVRAHAGRRTG